MSVRPLTKRLLFLETILVVFFFYSLALRLAATNFRTGTFLAKERQLGRLPNEIAGWRTRGRAVPAPHFEERLPRGLTIMARWYHNDETGQNILLHLAYRYDPIPCYGRSGWKPVRIRQPVLDGANADQLRRNNVHEACLQRDGEEITVIFWGDNLATPRSPGSAAGSQKAGSIDWSSGALGDIQTSIARLFRKGDITVKIVSADPLEKEERRESLLRFATETFNLIVQLLE